MTRLSPFLAALLLSAPAVAQDQASPPAAEPTSEAANAAAAEPANEPANAPDPRARPQQFDLAREKVINCEGEKFVFAWGIGANPTKVTLCSDKGATTDEVIKMLDEAATKIEQTKIAEDRRTAIVQQIRAKIDELRARKKTGTRTAEVAEPPPPPALISALPPLPRPPVATPYRPVPLPPRPRLSFECMTVGEFAAAGPCVTLTRDTTITVRAREAVAAGYSLRFTRQGEDRADIGLGSMRKGQAMRIAVPQRVCSGVVTSEVELRITSGGRVVGTEGPFLLRC